MKQILNYILQTKNPYRQQYIFKTQYDTYTIIQTYTSQGETILSIHGLDNVLRCVGGTLQFFKKMIESGETIIGGSLRTLKPQPLLNTATNHAVRELTTT